MRALLREWLSEAGYRVRAGSRCGVQSGGPADLVIVSVYMPKHAGAQLVREMQAAHPDTPLIAISGYAFANLASPAPDFLRMAHDLGAARCLRKPLAPATLLNMIDECLAEARPRGKGIAQSL